MEIIAAGLLAYGMLSKKKEQEGNIVRYSKEYRELWEVNNHVILEGGRTGDAVVERGCSLSRNLVRDTRYKHTRLVKTWRRIDHIVPSRIPIGDYIEVIGIDE